MRLLLCFLLLIASAGCASSSDKSASKVLPTSLEEAVASKFRTPENKARDVYRHPVATLKFFGIQPTMTVVEVSPGKGWYSEILVPYLAKEGKYYAAAPGSTSEYMKKTNDAYAGWLSSHPEIENTVTITSFNLPDDAQIAPEASADMVLTFRNIHNWMSRGNDAVAFKAFFKALKPGGVLGVVEHRANENQPKDPKAKSGYVPEKEVIRMAEKAGFKLADKSEINANPKDTKDHPEGVWTLPPSLRLKEKGRAHYEAVGESDRMTLKFIKPAK